MKTKSLKKLELKKTAVSKLDSDSAHLLKGGHTRSHQACISEILGSCNTVRLH